MTADLHPRPDQSTPSEVPGVVFLLGLLAVLSALVVVFV